MLRELVIRDFAIIRHLEVSFHGGLNVLSGETGAGKSILVGAVNLILGSRASQEMIRSGAKEATVEGVFSFSDIGAVNRCLSEWELEPAQELVIRRAVSRSGRNRIFVNDQLITLQQLQQLTTGIISISGQHEHQLLLDADVHLDLLDAFGALEPQRQQVGLLYAEWSKAREELANLSRLHQEKQAQLEWMRFQLSEIESAQLQPDEDKLLEQERNVLKHASTLVEAARRAYGILYSERGAVLDKLAEVEKDLQTLGNIDSTQEHLKAHLNQATIYLDELAHSLQRYYGSITFDPQRLAAVEERLAMIQRLGKKYGGTLEHILARLAELRIALGQDESAEDREERLTRDVERLQGAYLEEAKALSERRRQAAHQLSGEVEVTLSALDMPHSRFSVHFDEWEESDANSSRLFTPAGIDRVEFLLSANPGEDLKPLARIASGGELSRILLALKSLLSLRGEAETLIFDEVDTGIGGRTAELVGLQLKRLAEKNQVVCITHLPQIACYGTHHYKVSKQTDGEETLTTIHALSPAQRVEELARMLGGVSISAKTRAHAKEFLQRAQNGCTPTN